MSWPLLPESRWLTNLSGLLRYEAITLAYPADQFPLDFPLARWRDATPDERQALDALNKWLTDPARQASLTTYGLRPAHAALSKTDTLFAAAEPYGIKLTLPPSAVIDPPSRQEATRLIQWLNTAQP